MLNYILVMLGGALGTGARFWTSGIVAERAGEFFPMGTLLVNITGSFMIGFCGGYTTFSSFSLQTLDLVRDGDWLKACLNALLSFACCLAAVWLGRVLALAVLPK